MATALYTKFKQALLNKEVDMNTDTIKAALVNNTYAQNLATDEFFDPAITGKTVGTPQTIANPTITDGIFDGDNVTFTAVAAGSTIEAIVIYQDTGTPTTARLIAYIDNPSNFPLATNGGDIVVAWDNGGNKIFAL